jgi:hypothetical protein
MKSPPSFWGTFYLWLPWKKFGDQAIDQAIR